jgi:hypothetical protein
MKTLRAYRIEGCGGVSDRQPALSDETVQPGTASLVNREFAAPYEIENPSAPDASRPSADLQSVFP